MTDIVKLLKENSGVSNYRITSTERESYELFFVHRKLETVRSTHTHDTDVTVYVDHDEKLGSANFAVHKHMTEDDIQKKISVAVSRAKLVFNEPYELPAGGTDARELESNLKDCIPSELAARIADAVFAADNLDGGSLNAVEIFLYKDTVNVKNSRGIDKTQVKYHAMAEAIPTWNENGQSVELYENYGFTEFDAAKITEEIAARMREVRDRYHAAKPETPLCCNVILNVNEIMMLADTIARNLTYRSIYSHMNLHKKGDNLQPGNDCDRLNITMRGSLIGATASACFDRDGFDLTDRAIISDGIVQSGFGGVRFASYLGEQATGDLACIELGTGTLTDEAYKSEPYVECISMSGLQVDLYNDYIGGEIRLAYYFDGETTRPITGVTMSARLSEVLSGLRLSASMGFANQSSFGNTSFAGPDKALLKKVSML